MSRAPLKMRFFNLPQETLGICDQAAIVKLIANSRISHMGEFQHDTIGTVAGARNLRLRSRAYSVRLSESKNDGDGARRFPRAVGVRRNFTHLAVKKTHPTEPSP